MAVGGPTSPRIGGYGGEVPNGPDRRAADESMGAYSLPQGAPEGQTQSPVEQEVSRISRVVAELSGCIAGLRKRLEPALAVAPPSPGNGVDVKEAVDQRASLTRRLGEIARGLECLRGEVVDFEQRIEL